MSKHLVSECNWPNGHPCPDCVSEEQAKLAQEVKQQINKDQGRFNTRTDFGHVWDTAPSAFTRYCAREDAEYFYLLGWRDGYGEGLIQGNDVGNKMLDLTLREMIGMMRARGLV